MFRIFLALIWLFSHLDATWEEVPVSAQGRITPLGPATQLWQKELSHSTKLKNLLWDLHFLGHTHFDNTPLFWISSAKLKEALHLPFKQDLFSYHELQKPLESTPPKSLQNEYLTLLQKVKEFEAMEEGVHVKDSSLFQDKLKEAGSTFKVLPSRYQKGVFYSLKALALPEVPNFTLYPGPLFEEIKALYKEIDARVKNNQEVILLKEALAEKLLEGYAPLAGLPYQEGRLHFPTLLQLKAERIYYGIPLIPLALALYILATFFHFLKKEPLSILFMLLAFGVHSLVLALRMFILERPPVSNMFETVLYVPWISVLVGLIVRYVTKNSMLLAASSLASIALLLLLQVTDINSRMENVQAVLNSQLWLTIHVLMVVGSYGVFLLASILGHFYLMGFKKESKQILHTIYLGSGLLITGTILGGVWAMQSWGRFWDWDPKEAWAFISISLYLLLIHSFTFNRLGTQGLARGAIVGFLFITFTWYGVNYILGTGLHSYGFGSGGEIYYYAFLMAEVLFLLLTPRKLSDSTWK